MKRLITILTMALFVIASCTLNPVDENMPLGGRKVPVSIKAEQFDEGATKTVRNEDKSVSWMPFEEISVVCGTEKAKFTSINSENALIATFNGELSETTVNAINNGTSNYCVWGLYPYDENVESDGTYITTTLPSQQTGVAGTFADDLFITLAQSNNFNLFFYNVCSGFKFSVTKEGITSITLRGNNNEDIAGKVRLTFVDGKPKADVVAGQKTITLTPEGKTFEVGKDYYFVILPTEFTQGFTVTFNTLSQTGTFVYGNPVSFPRSKFVNKSNVDASIEYGAKEGNIYIPDANFKAYCVENFDLNHDGEISYYEANNVYVISVYTNNITSLEGLEYFNNLWSLDCKVEYDSAGGGKNVYYFLKDGEEVIGQLTSLDISYNTNLKRLSCIGNQLTHLDVSRNTVLEILICACNPLGNIDVSNNLVLSFLNCNHTSIESLDLSNNPNLSQLLCDFNLLTSLDLSNNSALTHLSCSNNDLTSLNLPISSSPLISLDCSCNLLTSLVIQSSTLKELNCQINKMVSLDVNNAQNLEILKCNDNLLTELVVSSNPDLLLLWCYCNNLTFLDVSYNTHLYGLSCEDNPSLTEIRLKKGQSYSYIYFDDDIATIVYVG